MRAFLCQEDIQSPTEYLKQACRESSKYMPIYYFARLEGWDLKTLDNYVRRELVRRNGLQKRTDGATIKPIGSLDSGHSSADERRSILNQLREGNVESLHHANSLRLLEAVTHLEPSSPPTELLSLLAAILKEKFDSFNSNQRTHFRKAVARLDEVLNRRVCAQWDVVETAM